MFRFFTPNRIVLVFLALLTAATYAPALQLGLVNLDDPLYVGENPRVHAGLTWDNVRWAFTAMAVSNWHPLTWLSYMLDVSMFGTNPTGFHATNIALHVGNVLVLFAAWHSMTASTWRSALVAALFAVHPLHVESVAWVAERKDVLSTFFGLLAIWAYVDWTRRRTWLRYGLLLVLYACSLMSKPMLVTLPCVLLLLDWWPLKRIWISGFPILSQGDGAINPKSKIQNRELTWLLIEKFPLLLMAAATCFLTLQAQRLGLAMEALASLTFPQRLANAGVAYAAYVQGTLWPVHLAVMYPHRGDWPAGRVALSAALLIVISVAAIVWRRRHPHLLVGWLWFLGTLVPVIGLVQVGPQAMADRYTYAPSIGLLIMLVWSMPAFRLTRRWGVITAAANGIVLAALCWRTMVQIGHWSDSLRLFAHAAKVVPNNDLAHNYLSGIYLHRGNPAAAREHLDQALRINPRATASQDCYGIALLTLGEMDAAVEHFQRMIRIVPQGPQARNNLGFALYRTGRFDQAIKQFETALGLRPDYLSARINLAQALAKANRVDEAIAHYQEALRLNDRQPIVHCNLGLLWIQKQRWEAARAHFLKAIRLDPKFTEAHANLGIILSALGRKAEAVDHLEEAARLQPDNETIREQLHRARQKRRGSDQ